MISYTATMTDDILEDSGCDRYDLVESILSATNYYEALGLSYESTFDEIRRAYIQKSRICHPDKFVPPYSKATTSFQVLSTAYNTLSEPAKRLAYDTYQKSGLSLSHYTSCCSEDNAIDIFQQVIRQLYVEIMEGEFQTLRTVIHTMNEANSLVHISDDLLTVAEIGFLKIRDIILTSQKYYSIIQFELLRLYDLQNEIKSLSYLNVWRRLSLSIAFAKILIQIPLLVSHAMKKNKEVSPLGYQIECGLEKAISVFESSEEYAFSWCNSTKS